MAPSVASCQLCDVRQVKFLDLRWWQDPPPSAVVIQEAAQSVCWCHDDADEGIDDVMLFSTYTCEGSLETLPESAVPCTVDHCFL